MDSLTSAGPASLILPPFVADALIMSNWDAKRYFTYNFQMLDGCYLGVTRKSDKIFTIPARKMAENVGKQRIRGDSTTLINY